MLCIFKRSLYNFVMEKKFKINSKYSPAGDQPKAIKQLVEGVKNGYDTQTLLGITGSGKTFTIANVIEQIQKPTLIIAHNKTLAAQLYNEFKELFPENAVEYFISYYDYLHSMRGEEQRPVVIDELEMFLKYMVAYNGGKSELIGYTLNTGD